MIIDQFTIGMVVYLQRAFANRPAEELYDEVRDPDQSLILPMIPPATRS